VDRIKGRFAVVGNPIGHSLSPQIHAAFARQTGRTIDYRAEQIDLEGFETWVADFFACGGRGLNVTLPFKSRAHALAGFASERANAAGAANFLTRDPDGQVVADNTDGKGLVTDMVGNAGWSLGGARILILGAGGAVMGVMSTLLAEDPSTIHIVNRTASRAEALAARWSNSSVSGGGYETADAMDWDVIINGTSTGLSGDRPALPASIALARGCVCYDMAYGEAAAPFLAWSREQGANDVRDGLGMLVEQAAESYFLWLGEYPQTQSLLSALRGG
jgi:shikimate dehydrogenase